MSLLLNYPSIWSPCKPADGLTLKQVAPGVRFAVPFDPMEAIRQSEGSATYLQANATESSGSATLTVVPVDEAIEVSAYVIQLISQSQNVNGQLNALCTLTQYLKAQNSYNVDDSPSTTFISAVLPYTAQQFRFNLAQSEGTYRIYITPATYRAAYSRLVPARTVLREAAVSPGFATMNWIAAFTGLSVGSGLQVSCEALIPGSLETDLYKEELAKHFGWKE